MLAGFLDDMSRVLAYKATHKFSEQIANNLQSVSNLRLTTIPPGLDLLLDQYYIACCYAITDDSVKKTAAEANATKIEEQIRNFGYSLNCGIEAIQLSAVREAVYDFKVSEGILKAMKKEIPEFIFEIAEEEFSDTQESSEGTTLEDPFETAKEEFEKKKDAAKTGDDKQEKEKPPETGGTQHSNKASRKTSSKASRKWKKNKKKG